MIAYRNLLSVKSILYLGALLLLGLLVVVLSMQEVLR